MMSSSEVRKSSSRLKLIAYGGDVVRYNDFFERQIELSESNYKYSRPLNSDQIIEKGLNDLLDCPIHSFRAKTGIELIHREPTLKELNRIYDNWNNMTPALKRVSDKKSIDFFGMGNIQHYNVLKNEYSQENNVKTASKGKSPFAVFLVAKSSDGKGYAATTRASDRGEAGRIGLPGGKVDAGEDPVSALYRESEEEGWRAFGISKKPAHKDIIDGNEIWWYLADSAEALSEYKEKSRGIKPIVKSIEELSNSGYGNEWLRSRKQLD